MGSGTAHDCHRNAHDTWDGATCTAKKAECFAVCTAADGGADAADANDSATDAGTDSGADSGADVADGG